MITEKLLNLDPSEILIRDNVRFALKPYRVESLSENILQVGGVREPVLVEELEEPVDGKKYALQVGNYRYAAVSKLNSEQKAGLTLPCRVVAAVGDQERLLAQVAENQERENMSPMDRAIAIKKMLDAGISKIDVRKAFSAPGGRKGIKVQPASNSHVNILLSFLDFPKDIQKKIHDGVIGSGTAYQLTKYPRDKWDSILEAAETERIKDIDKQEKDEETFLAQSKKSEEAAQEQKKTADALTQAEADAEKARNLAKEKADELLSATSTFVKSKGEDRDKAKEHKKAVEQELRAAQQIADAAEKELTKLKDKAQTAAEKAQAAKERLEAARKAKVDKAAKVTGKDLDKAAKKAGAVKDGLTKLNNQEKIEAIKSLTILSKPTAKYPKTIMVGTLIEQCFNGSITDAQLQMGIARIVGELPPVAAPKK